MEKYIKIIIPLINNKNSAPIVLLSFFNLFGKFLMIFIIIE